MPNLDLSPAQGARLAALREHFPASYFEVESVDPFSCLAIVECENPSGFDYIAMTADGRNVPSRVAEGWAATS